MATLCASTWLITCTFLRSSACGAGRAQGE